MVKNMKINEYLNKKKFFEFYILNIDKKDNNYEEIISVFSDAILNPYILNGEKHTFVFSTDVNNDMNQLVNAIEEDFGMKFKVFKSNKINVKDIEHLETLKLMYFKYEKMLNSNFITIKDLAQTIIERSLEDLENLKPVIISRILNDPKLLEIVDGMFMNDLNVCKTANYVYMHRNTINNKLQVIKEETGLDIQKFKDAVILYALIKK